jgi:hypothetical protein
LIMLNFGKKWKARRALKIFPFALQGKRLGKPPSEGLPR